MKCRECGAEIEFVELVSGKKMPVDKKLLKVLIPYDHVIRCGQKTGWQEKKIHRYVVANARQSHFATCTKPDLFRRGK